ncbi:MAG: YigZ family protein [Chitinophagaceae bacterium]|nr:YigZ family protein [Chitinophagaceae bacterium]
MDNRDFFYTIEKESLAEFKDRGSRFLAYAFPIRSVDDFKTRLQQLKEEHPKAVHHCFAYRLGTDGNLFRSSDDGEPSGSAGRPILGQIDSRELVDMAVVVVRYFGGTLLGVPGLINAYKNSTAMTLQTVPLVQRAVVVPYRLQFDYTQMNPVMTLLKQCGCQVIKNEIQLFCMMEVNIPRNRETELLYKLKDLYTVEVEKVS